MNSSLRPPSEGRSAHSPVFLLALVLILTEVAARLLFATGFRGLEQTRQILAGERLPSPVMQNCFPQPYLLYIPTPNWENDDGLQHNAAGFRGPAVPMRRRPGFVRILCLGGSTTYGWGVNRADRTYPAFLKEILEASKPPSVRGIEVINAGLPSGTTAEILTHYHFKFHFFHPDVILINPGGNDARALVVPFYHPDYSNSRHQLQFPEPWPPLGRALLKSRLAALFLISAAYDPRPNARGVQTFGTPPVATWYEPMRDASGHPTGIPGDEIAFVHNLQATLDEMKKDGARVLLLPFRPNPHRAYEPAVLVAQEERWLERMARMERVAYAPFPASVIDDADWLDDCHTNADGNRRKAAYLAPFVRALLQSAPRR